MPSNNWDKIHMWQNRAGDAVDRAIAREKKAKANGSWKPKSEPKGPKAGSWLDKYPAFGRWERALEDSSRRSINDILAELRDFGGMKDPQNPRKAYEWLKELYDQEVPPNLAWIQIKDILGWH